MEHFMYVVFLVIKLLAESRGQTTLGADFSQTGVAHEVDQSPQTNRKSEEVNPPTSAPNVARVFLNVLRTRPVQNRWKFIENGITGMKRCITDMEKANIPNPLQSIAENDKYLRNCLHDLYKHVEDPCELISTGPESRSRCKEILNDIRVGGGDPVATFINELEIRVAKSVEDPWKTITSVIDAIKSCLLDFGNSIHPDPWNILGSDVNVLKSCIYELERRRIDDPCAFLSPRPEDKTLCLRILDEWPDTRPPIPKREENHRKRVEPVEENAPVFQYPYAPPSNNFYGRVPFNFFQRPYPGYGSIYSPNFIPFQDDPNEQPLI